MAKLPVLNAQVGDRLPNRWVADAPLVALGVVAAVALATLGWLSVQLPPGFDPLVACSTLAATWLARGSAAATLLPGLVALMGLTAGGIAVAHQALVTRRVVKGITGARQPLPSWLRREALALGMAGRVDYVANQEAFAFCYGWRRPRVCVSNGLTRRLDRAELAAVLRHEVHHARHLDPFKILVGRALASSIFFLPLGARLRDGYLAGKELTADVEAAGPDRLPLARALLKLLDGDPVWPSGVVAVSALSANNARVAWLLDPSPLRPLLPSRSDWLQSLVVVAALALTSHTALAAGTTAALHAACDVGVRSASVTSRPAALMNGAAADAKSSPEGPAADGGTRSRISPASPPSRIAINGPSSSIDADSEAVRGDNECSLLLPPCRQPLAGWQSALCRQGWREGCGLLRALPSP